VLLERFFKKSRLLAHLNSEIRNWCECEQKLNSFDLYSGNHGKTLQPLNIEKKFLPQSSECFAIPYVYVPISQYEKYFIETDALNPSVRDSLCTNYCGEMCFRFFLHPSSVSDIRKLLPTNCTLVAEEQSEFLGSPTSSLRSLVVWNAKKKCVPFIVKVSVFAVSYGFLRHTDWEESLDCYRVRTILKHAESLSLLSDSIGFFDEVAFTGIPLIAPMVLQRQHVIDSMSNEMRGIGNIVRVFPASVLSGDKKLFGCTAYVSLQRPKQSLLEAIANSSKVDPLTSLYESMIDPGIKSLTEIMENTGLILEPHAQNLMVETDRQLQSAGRVWYRDFAPVIIDPLQAFLNAPSLLKVYENLYGSYMSIETARKARRWSVKSLGYNFLFCNVSRALLMLVRRNILSDASALNEMERVNERLCKFLSHYLQEPNIISIFTNEDRVKGMNEFCSPKLQLVNTVTRSLSYQEFTQMLTTRVGCAADGRENSKKCIQFSKVSATEDLTWYEHENGLIEAQKGEILRIFPYNI
jgi:hypothetical protein